MSGRKSNGKGRAITALVLILANLVVMAGSAVGISDEGRAFKPTPISQVEYGISDRFREVLHPVPDPEKPEKNEVDLALEYWLPTHLTGEPIREGRFPVVVFFSPNQRAPQDFLTPLGFEAVPPGTVASMASFDFLRDILVPRGYAAVFASARGTGRSAGCVDDWSQLTADDGSRIIEWAGKRTWSTGRVGMYGQSGSANNLWSTALSGDPDKIKYLKAIIPSASFASLYDIVNMDGAPNTMRNLWDSGGYNIFGLAPPTGADHLDDRLCGLDQMPASTEASGDFIEYWQDREHRDSLPNFKVPTLIAQGLMDTNVPTRGYMGLLDQWPHGVPLKVLLGAYRHSTPADADQNPSAKRLDWFDMVVAWYDRWLKELPTGVENWPPVQVQDANGQWREEREWVGGTRNGALALSASSSLTPVNLGQGILGEANPRGKTSYVQAEAEGNRGMVSFTTPPLSGDLRIYGDPILDIWLKVSDKDAKVGVRLDVVDPGGAVRGLPYASTFGARSMRHLDPFVDGRFVQEVGQDPKLNEAFRTTIRLNPTDMLVPAGWRLRLSFFSIWGDDPRISGQVPMPPESAGLSGSGGTITVLHDCPTPTVLRFAMADPNAKLLNAREPHEQGKELTSEPPRSPRLEVDGGGLARSSVC